MKSARPPQRDELRFEFPSKKPKKKNAYTHYHYIIDNSKALSFDDIGLYHFKF